MNRRSKGKANLSLRSPVADGPSASVGGWTKPRPVSLGLLPSGPDPVGERYVLRQPPAAYVDHEADGRKGPRGGAGIGTATKTRFTLFSGQGKGRHRDRSVLKLETIASASASAWG